jgi:hypothetical protein
MFQEGLGKLKLLRSAQLLRLCLKAEAAPPVGIDSRVARALIVVLVPAMLLGALPGFVSSAWAAPNSPPTVSVPTYSPSAPVTTTNPLTATTTATDPDGTTVGVNFTWYISRNGINCVVGSSASAPKPSGQTHSSTLNLSATLPASNCSVKNAFTSIDPSKGDTVAAFASPYDSRVTGTGSYAPVEIVNSAPVAVTDSVTVTEDSASNVIAVLANDTDADAGDQASFTLNGKTNGSNGTVAIGTGANANKVLYTPNTNFAGTDSFTYTVTDPSGGSATGTVSVTVTNSNDAPVGRNDSASTDEDVAVSLTKATLTGNDTDVDGDSLDITGVNSPSNGIAILNADDSVTFTPAANYSGPAGFNYTVSDGNGGTSAASVTVTVASVNDVPVAGNDLAETDEDDSVTLSFEDLLSNDTDVESATLDITDVNTPSNGTVVLNDDDSVTFTPDPNYNGPAGFDYVVVDGDGGEDVGSVVIDVSAVNDVPVAADDSATMAEDTQLTLLSADLLDGDSDVDGDDLEMIGVSNPVNGIAVLNSDDSVTFTPYADYNGPAGFDYTISDGNGGLDSATVTITVTDAPEPVETTPEPVETTPEPEVTSPEPVETTPEPEVTSPEPVETTPEPVETTPEPLETTPEPVETTPEPEETSPAPVETTPAPVETTPAPVETTPAPVETTPAPVETTPAPEQTAGSGGGGGGGGGVVVEPEPEPSPSISPEPEPEPEPSTVEYSSPLESSSVNTDLVSPNGDGKMDALEVAATFSEQTDWQLTLFPGAGSADSVSTDSMMMIEEGSGTSMRAVWTGTDSAGRLVSDGDYHWRLTTADPDGNEVVLLTGEVAVDRTAPVIRNLQVTPKFNPKFRSAKVSFSVTEASRVRVKIVRNGSGRSVLGVTLSLAQAGGVTIKWDGRNRNRKIVKSSNYKVVIRAVDGAQNVTTYQAGTIKVR